MEGYICKFYSHPLHLAEIDDKNYLPNYCIDIFKNYWSENGVVENLQVILLTLSICLLFSIRTFFYDNNKLPKLLSFYPNNDVVRDFVFTYLKTKIRPKVLIDYTRQPFINKYGLYFRLTF